MSVLILVEGIDDHHTISNLIARGQIGRAAHYTKRTSNPDSDFVVKPLDGYARLRRSLKAELISDEFTRFAIVVDADTHPLHRWRSLTDRLQELQTDLAIRFDQFPEEPTPDGAILRTNSPLVVGIWLWPDNLAEGDMEAFAGQLTPADDPLWRHSGQVIESLPETRFAPTHRPKARIHTWLAWQNPPGQQLGEAIRNNTLQGDNPIATRFLAFLTTLKEDPQ